jgi:hypothetical protein
MSCERYQRLLQLNREGEITEEELRELRLHVKQCERCAFELQRIERADGFIDRIRVHTPVPAEPERLTANIMRGVRAEPATSKPVNPIDRVLDFFLLPRVRHASIAVILLMTSTFLIELGGTFNRISDLERHLATPPHNDAVAVYTVQSKTLQQIATSDRGRPIMDNVALTVTNDRFDIPVKDADALLSGIALKNVPALVGTSVLGIDRKTFENIINEVQSTAELTFRIRHQGA